MAISAKPVFWRRTPPAVFPPILGLFGLGLGWRRAVDGFAISPVLADLILGATTMLFLLSFGALVAKYLARPEALIEDMGVLPGRVGLAAASLSVMLLAAAMVPFSERLASFLLTCGLLWHFLLIGLMAYVLMRGPAEQRRATPAWHLTFVGFIVGPLSAAPLGMDALAQGLLIGTTVTASVVFGISIEQLVKRDPPPPLRPLLAIHLSPLSLLGTAAALLGLTGTAIIFAILSTLVLAVLIWKARYLTISGFSPLWGAFTFPLAAYAGMMLELANTGAVFGVIGGLALVAATLIIPYIAIRVVRMWSRGTLSMVTNAAVA